MTKPYLQAAREALTRNAKTTSVGSLENRGLKAVRVIRAGDILQLIEQAVDRALCEHEEDRPQRDQLVGESQAAFQELASQEKALHDALLHAADLERQLQEVRAATADGRSTDGTQQERDAARRELEELRELNESLQQEREQWHARLEELTTTGESSDEATRPGQELQTQELQTLCASLESQLAEASAEIGRYSELQEELSARQAELEEQRRLRRELEIQVDTLRETMVAPAAVESIMEEIRTLKESVVESGPSLDDSRTAQGEANASMERLTRDLAERLDRISRKVGVSVGDEPAPDLERIFQSQLDAPLQSNLDNLKIKERKGGSVAGALARIKALKRGSSGQDDRDDEPVREPTTD